MGALIINFLKSRFPIILFHILTHLSLISIICYTFINLLKNNLPFIPLNTEFRSYILYGVLPNIDPNRNIGMFWEPGAHAGILTLCLALNFNHLKYYLKSKRFHFIIICITLLSTQSTAGYMVGFFILILYHLKSKYNTLNLISVSIFFIVGYFVFESNSFLNEKTTSQFTNSQEQKIGEFSNTRFGSVIFDLHYFYKHPFIGNGFYNKTRYSDHKELLSEKNNEDLIRSGNSFSHYLASMGIFFILGYFILLWKSIANLGVIFKWAIIFVVFFNLQSEQWYNYPLYLGLPFLNLRKS